MAQKKKRKNNKKQTNTKRIIMMILFVIILIGVYFYNTNPVFKSKVDTTVQKIEYALYGEPEHVEESQQNSSVQIVAQEGYILLPEELENPICPANSHAKDHELRDYQHYSICYRENYEQAEWSAYRLTSEQLIKNAKRTDDFRSDPEITTESATLSDYKSSGYDRGHLTPAADMAFSQEAMSETFYMSNMSPQAGGFNRGIWKDLEAEVREWTKKFGRTYVVSGPIFDKPAEEYKSIGSNKVSVPEYYYKVILAPLYEDENDAMSGADTKGLTAIGFIFPNKKCTDSYFNYAVNIDEVEKRTGLDFFSQLEDSVEHQVESSFDINKWQ